MESLEVIKDYGYKAGAHPQQAVHVKDGSQATFIKIWGGAPGITYATGSHISVVAQGAKGKIEPNEYQGKISLNCNDCLVTVLDGGQPAVASTQPTYNPPVPVQVPVPDAIPMGASPLAKKGMTLSETQAYIAARVASYVALYTPFIEQMGMTADGVGQMAVDSVRLEPMHFFGEKYLKD